MNAKSKYKILVVEDCKEEWQGYRTALDVVGATYEMCQTRTEALTHLSAGAFNLILFDLGLMQIGPERDGVRMNDLAWGMNTLQEIHKVSSAPICIVTGHSTSRPAEELLRNIAYDCLVEKPFTTEQLVTKIVKVLRR
jgi:DNA-binding NtrC family response regulator